MSKVFVCKKANNKLRALVRAVRTCHSKKKKLLMSSSFNAQFNFCPLILVLHSRSNKTKIKHRHERRLRLQWQAVILQRTFNNRWYDLCAP